MPTAGPSARGSNAASVRRWCTATGTARCVCACSLWEPLASLLFPEAPPVVAPCYAGSNGELTDRRTMAAYPHLGTSWLGYTIPQVADWEFHRRICTPPAKKDADIEKKASGGPSSAAATPVAPAAPKADKPAASASASASGTPSTAEYDEEDADALKSISKGCGVA